MNLLRPIAFGIFAISMGAQAQYRTKTDTVEPKVCPPVDSPEAKKAAIESIMNSSLTAYVNKTEKKEDTFSNPFSGKQGDQKPASTSSSNLATSHDDKWDWKVGAGFGLSGKGDRKAIGYPSDAILDSHLFVEGKYNVDTGLYVGFFGKAANYFDNVNAVDTDRTDSSAVATGLIAGGTDCFGEGFGWEAKFYQAKDNPLGMDERQRGQVGLVLGDFLNLGNALGYNKGDGFALNTKVGFYNEDVTFNSSVGGGKQSVLGIYCSVETEIPLTETVSAIARVGGSFEELSSLNEYTWGAGVRCKKVAFGADVETTYDRVNRDGNYSAGGDDDMINLNFVWNF